jgi:hypothetical protein
MHIEDPRICRLQLAKRGTAHASSTQNLLVLTVQPEGREPAMALTDPCHLINAKELCS